MRNVPWTARLVVIFESLKEIGVSFLVLALAKVHLASTFYTHTLIQWATAHDANEACSHILHRYERQF